MADCIACQDDNSLAINNSPIRKWLTLIALKTTARVYQWNGPCVPISSRIVVKKGKNVYLTEAATMAFIAARTKIPVPRVHCSFTRRNVTYIVMERMRGKTLADAWPSLSDADVERILLQLRGMLGELRAVPAPGIAIQSCIGGSLRDSRIPRPEEPRFGPFSSAHAFHEWLREGLGPEEKPRYVDDEEWIDIKYMIAMQNRKCEGPVFTHGDLNPFNIIVRKGNIEAIIDWEFSGWLPPYWEYTSVWLGNKTRGAWQQMAAKFIDPWPNELRMETIRQKCT
ncbi:serine threonine kinase [Cordyceps militaris]|uniref:Serine threonine kinase n=1 Tax=Cordyceps militaris TaxID=73501 RepID=A0A2H4SBV9_CORMI|nr:serine threonine kinase [Cordyceps militaris]